MTSEVQQTYYGWQHGELSVQEDSQGPVSISQVIDHGSISFGRFAIESLSWQKRSVFTHNEIQAELENFKLPGLVAKKRAYFEEYYKKIRALKAMQNQQTEISLDYGADGSISSQTGDEDEPVLPSTMPNKIPENTSQAPLEDLLVKVSFEQECSEAFEHECMVPGSLKDAVATETVELHNSEVKQGGTCNNSSHMQISDAESFVHSLLAGSSGVTHLSDGNHLKLTYNNDAKLIMQPDATTLVCFTDPTISDIMETYYVTADNPILEKKMLTSKTKDDPILAPMSKETAASARYLSKTVHKSISEMTKPSLGSMHLLQKAIDKADIDITCKKASCKTRSRDKFPFVASQRSLTELQNKVDVPRPVSVSRERKGAIHTESRVLNLRSPKVSTRSASGQVYMKGNSRVHGDSRQMSTHNTVKNRALQSKSIGHGEFANNLESKRKAVERRTTSEQLNSRSINLPSRNNPDLNGVIVCQSGSSSCGDKSKKAKSPTGRRHEGKGSKLVTTFQQSKNIKIDSAKKQAITSQKQDSSFGARKSSIVGKNSRQENPRWR